MAAAEGVEHSSGWFWRKRRGSRGRVEMARRWSALCSATSPLQLELSYAGGWEQARPLGARSRIVCPQGKQCPPNRLGPCCLLHLSPPGLNQRCVSGFVAVTPLCLSWNLVLSNPAQLALDGGLSLCGSCSVAGDCSVMSSIVRRGRIGKSPVTVSLGDALWNTPESSIFVYFRCDQRPQL